MIKNQVLFYQETQKDDEYHKIELLIETIRTKQRRIYYNNIRKHKNAILNKNKTKKTLLY